MRDRFVERSAAVWARGMKDSNMRTKYVVVSNWNESAVSMSISICVDGRPNCAETDS